MRSTYRIGGWFGRYLWISIPGGFVAAAVLAIFLDDLALTVFLMASAVVNAVTMLFLISIRTIVDQDEIEQSSWARRERTPWHEVSRGVLTTTKEEGKDVEVHAIELQDRSRRPFAAGQVGRRPDGERETLLERMRRELDERSIPRDW